MTLLNWLTQSPASNIASSARPVTFLLLGLSLIFTFGVYAAIVYLVIKYRRGADVNRTNPPESNWKLEATWIGVPLVLGIIVYSWSATVYFNVFVPPPDAKQVYVLGKQWMWKIYHPEGRNEIGEMHIPVGKPIAVTLASQDVVHDFFIPEFHIKMDAVPGKYTQLWFEAKRPGDYWFLCAQYCGTGHSVMRGKVVAMEPADYASWIKDQPGSDESVVVRGERSFKRLGCGSCHNPFDNKLGPFLKNIAGSVQRLADGREVVADDSFLRRAILDPEANVISGYPPAMPGYRGQVDEEELIALIAYIKSLQ